MRLPLAIDIDSRNGSSTKDARSTNVLVTVDGQTRFSEVRPGLTVYGTTGTAAIGQGGNCFNGTFCAIYGGKLYKPSGGTLGAGVAITSASVSASFDFAQSPT